MTEHIQARDCTRVLEVRLSVHPGYVHIEGYDYPVADLIQAILKAALP